MADVRELHVAVQQQRQEMYVQDVMAQLGVQSGVNPFKKRPRPLTDADLREQVKTNIQGFFRAYGTPLSDETAMKLMDLLQKMANTVEQDAKRFKAAYNNGKMARIDRITDGNALLSDAENANRTMIFVEIIKILRSIGFPKKAIIPEFDEKCELLDVKYKKYGTEREDCVFYSKFRYITENNQFQATDFHVFVDIFYDTNALYGDFKRARGNFLDPSVQIEKDVGKTINVQDQFDLTLAIYKKLFIDGLNKFLLKLRGEQLILSYYKSDYETLPSK